MACRLVALDVAPGPQFVRALLDAWEAGDAVLPVDARLPGPARARLFDELRPGVLVDASGTTELRGGRPLFDGDAVVVATSGTTGVPKGVVLTHDAVRASARITSERLGVDPSRDHWVACLPLGHIGGLSVVTRALCTSTPLTVLPRPDADGLSAARRAGATLVSLVPAALDRVEPSDWRVLLLGGSAMPASLPPNAVRTYGMTETGSGVVYDTAPLSGVEVRIDPATSEVLLRTPTLGRAYLTVASGPEGLALAGPDGWYATGDAGAVDSSGVLSIRGRIATVIVTGGEKVWPESVEPVLARVVGVREVAVLGVPDERWGQRLVAVIVVDDPASAPSLDALRDAVKAVLPAYTAPHELRVVDALPRTPSGKIARAELADS